VAGGGGVVFVVFTGGLVGFLVGFLVGLDVALVVVVVGCEVWLPDPPPTLTPTPTLLPVLRLMPLTPVVVVLGLDVGSCDPSVGITTSLPPVAAPAGDDELPSAICWDGVPPRIAPLKLPVAYSTGAESTIAAATPPTTGRRRRRGRGARCLPTYRMSCSRLSVAFRRVLCPGA